MQENFKIWLKYNKKQLDSRRLQLFERAVESAVGLCEIFQKRKPPARKKLAAWLVDGRNLTPELTQKCGVREGRPGTTRDHLEMASK